MHAAAAAAAAAAAVAAAAGLLLLAAIALQLSLNALSCLSSLAACSWGRSETSMRDLTVLRLSNNSLTGTLPGDQSIS